MQAVAFYGTDQGAHLVVVTVPDEAALSLLHFQAEESLRLALFSEPDLEMPWRQDGLNTAFCTEAINDPRKNLFRRLPLLFSGERIG
jgi:hypothetical protein